MALAYFISFSTYGIWLHGTSKGKGSVDRDPGRVMSDMKAQASRALTRAGFDDAARKRWTRHGSTLHLFDEATLADKIDYTLNRQGPPMAFYDGRND